MADLTITDLLRELAATKGASDLLITEGKPPLLRVNTEIVELDHPVLKDIDTEELCLSLLNQEQLARFKQDKEIDISAFVAGAGRYRVNIYQQRGFIAMVVRLVSNRIPTFEELRLPRVVQKFAMLPRGLVIVCGPVGSGKTTTVAAMVDYINRTRRCHIVSVEDPIEYVHSHNVSTVDQREVGSDTNSFADALRHVLRQSPDVVVVGEIRDRASAQAAITLAETGHLTLATLHTRGSIATVNRLIDMFPAEQAPQVRSQLAASLAGVLWQQLLPMKDVEGMTVAVEVLTLIPSVRALIRQGRTHEIYSIIQSGKRYDMCTMEQSLETLVEDNLIDSECANMVSPEAVAMMS